MSDDSDVTLGDLVGAWELEWVERETANGPVLARPPQISGILSYTPDGHMSVFFIADRQVVGFPFAAYAGTVSFEAGRVVHHVLLGTPPTEAGTTQLRDVDLDRASGSLTLSGLVGASGNTLKWRRLEGRAEG
ncbi:MAG TPA: hypothetical protein VGM10_08625 [Actinocrinis sp.]|jgi:hypothetical protein